MKHFTLWMGRLVMTAAVMISGLSASAATETVWQLVRSYDELTEAVMKSSTGDPVEVVLVSANAPVAISHDVTPNDMGVYSVDIEMGDDVSTLPTPPDNAIFSVFLDEDRNNLISINFWCENGYLKNASNLIIETAASKVGGGWICSDFRDGECVIETRKEDKYRYISLKGNGSRFNTDLKTGGESEMRIYMKREVEVQEPVVPEKPEAPVVSLSDGLEVDADGCVSLDGVEEEAIVTLSAPEGCTVWYRLAGEGSDFKEYVAPVSVAYADTFEYFSRRVDDGVESEIKTIKFVGQTIASQPKPEAPTVSLSDGMEVDEEGFVMLDKIDNEIAVTLTAPEGCTAWYCLAYDGTVPESANQTDEFLEYSEPIKVRYAGTLDYYSVAPNGKQSDTKRIVFAGQTVTVGIVGVGENAKPADGYDINGRKLKAGAKGLIINRGKKQIIR